MVFIGERRGWELEVSTPGLAGNGGRRGWGAGAQNLLSYLGLGKTISYCSLFKKKKNWPRAWEILGQVQHLFCSKAQHS